LGAIDLFGLTYDLWNEIIDEIALAHDSLFAVMQAAAEDLQLSAALIDDLKSKREIQIANDPWELRLKIDFIEDKIGGFIIYLEAKEPLDILEQIKADVASDNGFSLEDIEGFEVEHGLDMDEEIFVEVEEGYGVQAEAREDEVVYMLVIFDSQDIDNSLPGNPAWQEDLDN